MLPHDDLLVRPRPRCQLASVIFWDLASKNVPAGAPRRRPASKGMRTAKAGSFGLREPRAKSRQTQLKVFVTTPLGAALASCLLPNDAGARKKEAESFHAPTPFGAFSKRLEPHKQPVRVKVQRAGATGNANEHDGPDPGGPRRPRQDVRRAVADAGRAGAGAGPSGTP